MDKFGKKLIKDPDHYAPDVFAERIKLRFRRKYHFRRRMLALSAVLLIIAGFCVVLPELASVSGQLNARPDILNATSNIDFSQSLQSSAAGLWQGVADFQDSILVAFNLPAWLGLFSVAIGSVIGIGGIFPNLHTR